MSLAADTARTASNMNKALTLDYFIHALEKREVGEGGKYVSATILLNAINDHLSGLERIRAQFLTDERLKHERELEDVLQTKTEAAA